MIKSTIVLSCSNIHKSFSLDRKAASQFHVLKGIDLEINLGEIVSIVGASGSGKSTLLHILGGLDRPSQGNVSWLDQDIFSLGDDTLATLRGKTVGFVFQFHHLLQEFTALENVMIPLMIQGTSLKDSEVKAAELLSKVGLIDRKHHKPSELSGGEQQRIAVARALANNPKIILADEPSGNLDSVSSRQLHELLWELNRTEKQTFVIVTHNEKFAEGSHRVFRMVDGKLQKLS
ncbi:MAG: ABC transporter ATP-binding protein [Ignavibacteriae bacterium]|nr:ABC transporter ATP-binding protein [Ignavibacteriota bacterium]